jgi:hypothetical protein
MNLLEIRTKFRDLSGRYDLVKDDFSDNGANFYINEGSKWLDRTVETTKSWASRMEVIAAGRWYVQFPFARAIKEVWAATSTAKWQLEKIRIQDMIASYYITPPAQWVNGTPLYYSPMVTRYIPEDITPVQLATFATYVGVIPNTDHEYNAIALSAPVDQDTLIDVRGLFYSIPLDLDTDENYWSSVHPMLLIQAAIRQTYVVSGNKPLLDILDRGIDGELTRLSYDLVEQIIAEIDQMDG